MARCRSDGRDDWDWETLRALALQEARRVLRDQERAQDAAQEASIRAWRHAGQCLTPTTPEAWLRTIARREALRVAASAITDAELPDGALTCRGPEADAIRRIDVDRAMRCLDARDRVLLRGRYWHDLSHAEIAADLGMPVGTVKVRLHRARGKLARALSH